MKDDYVHLGYESGHIVLFDRRSLAKQVTFVVLLFPLSLCQTRTCE